MKNQAVDYCTKLEDFSENFLNTKLSVWEVTLFKNNPSYISEGVGEAIKYIESRGVKVFILHLESKVKTRPKDIFGLEVPKDPKMPEVLVLYANEPMRSILNSIMFCLQDIQLYDTFFIENIEIRYIGGCDLYKDTTVKSGCEIFQLSQEKIVEVGEKPQADAKRDVIKNAHGVDIVQFAADFIYYRANPDSKEEVPKELLPPIKKALRRFIETRTTRTKGEENIKVDVSQLPLNWYEDFPEAVKEFYSKYTVIKNDNKK